MRRNPFIQFFINLICHDFWRKLVALFLALLLYLAIAPRTSEKREKSFANVPVHVELPIDPWGVEGRYKKHMNAYHFYVDDYRFERLFKDPIALLMSGCKQIVEPNCSIHDNTPKPFALWQIYRKRFLARYFQECGVQVFADLNVSHRFAEFNRLGIPDGYNAFFTRGVSGWQNHLDLNLEMAQRISGLDHPNLNVYGGGSDIEEWCYKHQVAYFGEFIGTKQRNDK